MCSASCFCLWSSCSGEDAILVICKYVCVFMSSATRHQLGSYGGQGPKWSACLLCPLSAEAPTVIVCWFSGLPGGAWQIVSLSGLGGSANAACWVTAITKLNVIISVTAASRAGSSVLFLLLFWRWCVISLSNKNQGINALIRLLRRKIKSVLDLG